jgi:hypothetical protein
MPTDPSAYESGRKFALQDERYKYILWTDGPHELYDVRRDPYEMENLIGTGLPAEDVLRRALLDRIDALKPVVAGDPGEADAAAREHLRVLGY